MVSEAAAAADLEVVLEVALQSKNISTFTYPHQNLKNSDHKDLFQSVKPKNTTKSYSSKHQVHQRQLLL